MNKGFFYMGIRKKVSLGFVIIGIILLLSSVISIYEFISMRRSVSNLITDNITSINTSRLLLEVTDEYNFKLLRGMGIDSLPQMPDLQNDNRFVDYLQSVKDKFTTQTERQMADSVLFAYTAYIHYIKDAPYIWTGPYIERRNWYFDRLYPVYMKLRGYIQKLTVMSQEALAENSKNMSDSFYRSIMPGLVAVSTGMILVILFNYFINLYLISPLLSISKGIKGFLQLRKTYNVPQINDEQLQELNENVKELIDTNKKLLKSKD